MQATQPKLLKVRQVAEVTGLAVSTVYALIAAGELPAVRVGRAVRVDADDLEAFIRRHKTGGQLAA